MILPNKHYFYVVSKRDPMLRILIFSLLILVSTFVNGQVNKVDSLHLEYKKAKIDTMKLLILKELSNQYSGTDFKRAQFYLDSMISFSRRTQNFKYELIGLKESGTLKFRQGLFKEGKAIWLSAVHKDYSHKYPKITALLLHNIAVSLSTSKKNDSAFYYTWKSLKINEENNYNNGLFLNYDFLSNEYLKANKNDSVQFYLTKLLEIAQKGNDPMRIARTHITLANLSRRELDNTEAIIQFKKALKIHENSDPNNATVHRLLEFEIAKSLTGAQRYKEALKALSDIENKYVNIKKDDYFDQGFDILYLNVTTRLNRKDLAIAKYEKLLASKSNATVSQVSTFGYLASLAAFEIKYTSKTESTLSKLEQLKELAVQIDDLYHYKELNALFSDYYIKVNDPAKAYASMIAANKNRDSITTLENKTINLAHKRKFEVATKENENLRLRAQSAEQDALISIQNTLNTVLSLGLGIALLASGIFYFYYRKNKKQKELIEIQKNKVEHLQKELHHRLKNNLSFIDVFISLAKGKFKDPAYQEKLNELQNRISSMFEVHEQLFNKGNITKVNASSYVTKLAENVKRAYHQPHISIVQEIDEQEEIDSQASFPLGIIINEFVTNSYKYAFSPEKEGTIKISLNESHTQYRLKLSDDGKGLPENFNLDTIDTFGLDSIKLLTEEYNGSFSLTSKNGVALEITIPKIAA